MYFVIATCTYPVHPQGSWVRTKDNVETVPVSSQKILQPYHDSQVFDNCFDYWWIIGKLNNLAMLMCADIQFAVYSCARYSTCPKQEHGEAIEYITRYLKGTSEVGMLFHPKKIEAFKVYVDANFAGNWLKEYAEFDHAMTISRSGLVMTQLVQYCGPPKCSHRSSSVLSRQNKFLSSALRDVIPLIDFAKKLQDKFDFDISIFFPCFCG